MRTSTIHAIILIATGIVALGYQGIINTSKKKIVAFAQHQHTMRAKTTCIPQLSPIIGAITLVGGIGLLIMVNKKN